jgi:hypothetical protein
MASEPMRKAWDDVAEHFEALGRMMKERYRAAGEPNEGDAGASGDSTSGLREAFDRLIAAGRDLGDRAADVARDDDVKAEARRAAASLNDALSATVDLIGDEVGSLFKRSKPPEPPEEKPPG